MNMFTINKYINFTAPAMQRNLSKGNATFQRSYAPKYSVCLPKTDFHAAHFGSGQLFDLPNISAWEILKQLKIMWDRVTTYMFYALTRARLGRGQNLPPPGFSQ